MNRNEKILEEFDLKSRLYDDFRIKIESLIKELLIQKNLSFHQINSRLKSKERLEEKLLRKNSKYSKLADLTDITGLRIITHFEDDVDLIAEAIDSEFEKDEKNSIDKRKIEIDRFGYKSLHYVISLSKKRTSLSEYKRFVGLKAEVQIRSILQHAWAEIEHDIGYKGEIQVPQSLKRNFHRVAALLETADIEFVNIKTRMDAYKKDVLAKLSTNSKELLIDKESFTAFVENDETVSTIDKSICKKVKREYVETSNHISVNAYEEFDFFEIKTISQLKHLLDINKESIIEIAYEWLAGDEFGTYYGKGICIFYLFYYLLGKSKDEEFIYQYFERFIYFESDLEIEKSVEKLVGIYHKLEN